MSDFGFDLPDDSDEEEAPDWLEGFGEEGQPEFDSSAEETPPEEEFSFEDSPIPSLEDHGEEQVPGWLQGIRDSEAAAEDPSTEIPQDDEPAEGDPAWLENIRQMEQVRHQEQAAEEPVDPFGDLSAAPEEQESAGSTHSASDEFPDRPLEEDSDPDWLSGLDDQVDPQTTEPVDDEIASQPLEGMQELDSTSESLVADPSDYVDTGSLPSWLVEIKRGETDAADAPPDDLGGQGRPEDFSPTDDFDLTPGDLPNWLSEDTPPATPDEVEAEPAAPAAEPQPDLARANLPNWLHAMRPVDSPLGPEQGVVGHEETIGPLSGLQNLIPAEPDIIQFGKSPAYSFQLDVTDSHQRSTGIFEELITTEDKPQKSRITVAAITQGAVRWVIAALLLLSIAIPVILGSDSLALPESDSPLEGVGAAQELVHAVPSEGLVLVAFDYQPSFTAELTVPAAAVLDHLLLRGAQLAIISTHPTGAAQGVNLLQSTLAEKHTYIADRLYTDLGYLSGGPAGMRAFAASPSAALPLFIDEVEGDPLSLWTQAPLDRIKTVADFAMLVVLTDSPEVSRAWIEQVEPQMGNTPLVMIVSEQAEPLIIPYYQTEAKQVDALMAGLRDGAYYEATLGTGELSRNYWNSYSAGLGISVAVIFLGTLVGAASMLWARLRKPPKEPKS